MCILCSGGAFFGYGGRTRRERIYGDSTSAGREVEASIVYGVVWWSGWVTCRCSYQSKREK